jgi:hypothetical protein
MALALVLLVFGPWPVDNRSFEGSSDQARTLDRLDASTPLVPAGPLRVGTAEIDLTPPSPRPLAGFIGQVRTPYAGVDSPCLARALTIGQGRDALTVLTADLLLIDARLAAAVCQRVGVEPDRIFFTASHTHGGPGGWGNHPLEMLVAGAYDPAWFDDLADRLADVVRRSRETTEPAEMAFIQVQTQGRQSNRVVKGSTTHDALSALVFRPLGGIEGASPLAVLVVFGAHATVSHPVPPRLGGDYPAGLVSELKRATGARSVLFAAGAVGDASPARPKAASPAKSAEALGSALAGDLLAALPSARFEANPRVVGLRVAVDLPPVRLPFLTPWLRFSPLATWWIADRRTHLHALRLGPAVLVGFPGDYSGHLADRLVESTRASGLSVVATSFDGDYRGYLVSDAVFREVPCYETRWMSFFGPWTGESLNDLARRMVDRFSDAQTSPPRPVTGSSDLSPRLALAALLPLAALAWRRRRQELKAAASRAGWLAVGVASAAALASLVASEAVDWTRVGLPDWARWMGLVPAVWALSPSARDRPGRALLLFGLGCGLLTASWPVAPMLLRGWARSGLSDRSPAATTATTAS